jgi:hypothetical protein
VSKSYIEAEDSTQVTRSAGWAVASGNLHGGEQLESSGPATLAFSFLGSALTVYYETGPTLSTFTVAIDGTTYPTVSENSGSGSGFTLDISTGITSTLAFTTHSVTLACNGNWCGIDYFALGCN